MFLNTMKKRKDIKMNDKRIMEIITYIGANSDSFSLHLGKFLDRAFVAGKVYEAREEFYDF